MAQSIRLTKAHREDIINSVMENWEKENPAPTVVTKADVAKEAYRLFIKGGRTTHLEDKATFQHFSNFKKFYKGLDVPQLTEIEKFYYPKNINDALSVHIVNESNEISNFCRFYYTPHFMNHISLDHSNLFLNKDFSPWLHPQYLMLDEPQIAQYEQTGKSIEYFQVPILNKLHIKAESDIVRQFKKGRRLVNDWEKEKNKIREEFSDYLNQFNTTNQIKEHWPNLVPFLPGHLADPEQVIKLPAIAKSRLNERLGI